MAIAKNPRESTKAKMRAFADLYRGGPDDIRGNAKACYKAVYPRSSIKVCEAQGARTLNHEYTQGYLRAKADESAHKADITQDRVLQEIARCGMYDMRKLFDDKGEPLPPHKLDDDIAAAVVGLKVTAIAGDDDSKGVCRYEYKLSDKGAAQEKLMKFLGLYEKDNGQKSDPLAEALIAGINRTKELDE